MSFFIRGVAALSVIMKQYLTALNKVAHVAILSMRSTCKRASISVVNDQASLCVSVNGLFLGLVKYSP
jgi:hypothetical protein